MLKVKKLDPRAMLPSTANVGTDLGYDLYALEDTLLMPGVAAKVRTGIAVELKGYGFEFGDRSSMAAKNIRHSGGKIDASYRGELLVVLTLEYHPRRSPYQIKAGDKIIQMLPRKPETHFPIVEVEELTQTARGEGGFGSTGT